MEEKIGVSAHVKNVYDGQYSEKIIEWRDTGGYYKAKHVMDIWARNFDAPPRRILEVGAGEGSILRHMSEANFGEEYHALEISESGLKIIRGRGLPQLAAASIFDGYRIEYGDSEFDLVILSHVLEHVEHERILLREIRRVGKHLSIEVPLDFSWKVDERVDHYLGYGHINIYTPPLLRFLLKSEGFDIIDDLPDMTGLKVDEMVHFEHRNIAREPEALKRFQDSYGARRGRFERLPRDQQEQEAKDYTALCRCTERSLSVF